MQQNRSDILVLLWQKRQSFFLSVIKEVTKINAILVISERFETFSLPWPLDSVSFKEPTAGLHSSHDPHAGL